MKKTIFLLLMLAFAINSIAQIKFYTNSGTTLITETKCGEYKDITVKVPVPPNVSTFDAFTVKVLLSSLDVKAICEYNKTKIQSKLAGKSEITLTLISADGTSSDFKFGDGSMTNADFCINPRKWNMDKITATVKTAGWMILSYSTESRWDDYKGVWITEQIPYWDEGEAFSEGVLTINQLPLSDGVSDESNKLSIKLVNTSKSTYTTYDPSEVDNDYEGGIIVNDESLGENLAIKILYFNESKHTLDFIKGDLLKLFTSGDKTELKWEYMNYFDYNNKLEYQMPLTLKKTSKEYESVNIESKDFFHFVYNQKQHDSQFYPNPTMPDMRVHIYIYYKAPYIVAVSSWITDDLMNKGEETITKAEEIIKSTVGSIKIN